VRGCDGGVQESSDVRGGGDVQAGDERHGVHLSVRMLAGGSLACGNRTDVADWIQMQRCKKV
jgi:hypothetical protein